MDNQLQLFNVEEFGNVRFIIIDNEPWFVGKDVARALGYQDTDKAIRQHVPDKFKRFITHKEWSEMVQKQMASNQDLSQQMASLSNPAKSAGSYSDATFSYGGQVTTPNGLIFIREPGLWRLVLRSNLPNAERFTDKVCEEILPSIRKTGMYIADPALRKRLEYIKETEQWAYSTGLSPKLRKHYADTAEALMKEFVERALANDEISKRAYALREKNSGVDYDTPHFLRHFIAEHCEFDRFARIPAEIFIKLLREEYPESTANWSNRQIVKDLSFVKGVDVIHESNQHTWLYGICFTSQNQHGSNA